MFCRYLLWPTCPSSTGWGCFHLHGRVPSVVKRYFSFLCLFSLWLWGGEWRAVGPKLLPGVLFGAQFLGWICSPASSPGQLSVEASPLYTWGFGVKTSWHKLTSHFEDGSGGLPWFGVRRKNLFPREMLGGALLTPLWGGGVTCPERAEVQGGRGSSWAGPSPSGGYPLLRFCPRILWHWGKQRRRLWSTSEWSLMKPSGRAGKPKWTGWPTTCPKITGNNSPSQPCTRRGANCQSWEPSTLSHPPGPKGWTASLGKNLHDCLLFTLVIYLWLEMFQELNSHT